MKQAIQSLLLFLVLFIIQSCATSDVEKTSPTQQTFVSSGVNLYLIGDAGKLENNESSKTLKALQKAVKEGEKDDVYCF